ncbi:genetic suppressor element 1 isoform X3 [Notamacropus eugenii]|uniref:genetic suppressor element 1 isoform X3 n=1 Tax=Notamacropus eugenii TaxID=9315 RepID=UPI003B66FC15
MDKRSELEKEPPISRKQRLMAAIASGGESLGTAAPGGGGGAEKPPSSGGGGSAAAPLSCFICGGGIGRGKELKLQVKQPAPGRGEAAGAAAGAGAGAAGPGGSLQAQPFFPFLQQQEPAPGAREVSPADGCVLVCAVCRCFLGEQWAAFERSRTPVEKRMYWLKRPYQCEAGGGAPGRRAAAPQEWNLSYALEPGEEDDDEDDDEGEGAGGDGGARRGARPPLEEAHDSDLSSLSDTDHLSEPEPAPGPAPRDQGSPGYGPPPPKEVSGCPQLLKPPPAPPQGVLRGPGTGVLMGRFREWPPSAGPPPHAGSETRIPGEGGAEGPTAQPDPGRKMGTRRKKKATARHWVSEDSPSVLRGAQGNWRGPPFQCPPGDGPKNSIAFLATNQGRATQAPGPKQLPESHGGYCTSEEGEINITSDEEDQKKQTFPNPCGRWEVAPKGGGPADKENGSGNSAVARDPWAPVPDNTCCYICGNLLTLASQHQIHVQKQEKTSQAPFFPFLWLHTPPPGALPISPGGSTLVCSCCFSSLMQQWQSFELANVPVLQRLYVVPLNPGMPSKGRKPLKEEGAPAGPQQEACYLCGEDCARDSRTVPTRIINGSAKNTMHFPFVNLLPCPPNAKGLNRHWEVHSCPKCYGVLEDIWSMYRACQNEELINSVQSFLGRYHQVFSTTDSGGLAVHPSVKGGPLSVCYICGAELGPGKEFQLNVNPPSRFGEKEPFFPFLTVYPPAPRARPADSTGLVATCVLCYHDLLGQWLQHEGRSSHHPISAWSRQYKVETFVCFFCQQEKKRCLGLKAVRVARLPMFLYTLRAGHSLLVDDGKQLIIGACVECGTVVFAGKALTHPGVLVRASPAATQKASSSSLEIATKPPVKDIEVRPGGPDNLDRGNRTVQEVVLNSDQCQLSGLDPESADLGAISMSHEPKSPSIGMLSTATRTTATVSPLTPSPLNGSLVPNGSPAATSNLSVQAAPSSSFAAALRKLAKQAEEPRGSSISSESSPVSSPATNHSSPASTPKRVPMGPIIVPPGGHSVPSTPPVVTIAPTKTVNGVWRSESRQQEAGSRSGSSRDRLIVEPPLAQEKAAGPAIPSHLLSSPYPFSIPPSSVVQDSRFPPLNSLQRPVHHVVPPSTVTEDYLRSFRPYHTTEDLRMSSLPPISLDPATAAAYYHPSYLAPHPFPHPAFRVDDSYCLSALRSPFYPIPTPGSLPPLHPSAMHLHLSGVRYPAELSHSSLSALQTERMSSLTAERLQMDEELRREREREREREKEREREADREREKEREREREREKELEREREKEREREREKELERQRERAREKELMVKTIENQFLPVSELHGLRVLPGEDRVKPSEQLTPNRPEKLKEPALQTPKAVQHPLHPAPTSHHPVPSLISNHSIFPLPGSSAATALLIQRTNEEEKWLARQRRLRQEKEDRQSQVSEFRQQVLEQHLDISRPPAPAEPEHRPENPRPGPNRHEPSSRDQSQHFGGPPPLISPKPQHHPMPTSLWNPVTLMENTLEPRRIQENHSLHTHPAPFEPSRQAIPLVKVERVFCPEKLEEGTRKREASLDKYQPLREPGPLEHSGYSHGPFLAELEKSTQTILNQQRAALPQPGQFPDVSLPPKPSSPYRPQPPRGPDPMYVYDEFLQQHRKLVSKLDLEERRRREAQEKGYYYDLDDSYDESDEEEVRAHLRGVAEQPPLKLDASSEKLEFLQLFGLTTRQQKEELLTQKRRKRRRMLRERSPSPPAVQNKRQTPSPRLALSTRYSPDEMNNSPNFEEKKRFLTIFHLTHISAEKRKDKEKLVEMLHAMKQKTMSAAVADSVTNASRDSPIISLSEPPMQQVPADADKPISTATSLSDTSKPTEPGRLEQLRPQELQRVGDPASEKARMNESHGGKKSLSMLHYVRGSLSKDIPIPLSHSVNGKNKPWEAFMAEEFAHQFHESVLQSTQKALQKHKGSTTLLSAEQNHKVDTSIHYNIPELQSSSRVSMPQHNGQQEPSSVRKGPISQELDRDSEEEDKDEDEEEEEEDAPRSKWQGIEAIFEAYQEHIEEQNLERHVLQTQCRRLEAQHYSLSLTAEQLSHSMAELRSQKQKIVSERERLQAELDHLRKCLALPAMQWSRGYFKGYPR